MARDQTWTQAGHLIFEQNMLTTELSALVTLSYASSISYFVTRILKKIVLNLIRKKKEKMNTGLYIEIRIVYGNWSGRCQLRKQKLILRSKLSFKYQNIIDLYWKHKNQTQFFHSRSFKEMRMWQNFKSPKMSIVSIIWPI